MTGSSDSEEGHGQIDMNEPTMEKEAVERRKMGIWAFIVLFVQTAALPCLFLLGFSAMGYGLTVAIKSYEWHDEAAKVIESTLIFIVFMYIFDVQFWPIVLQAFCCLVVFLSFCVAVCLMVTEMPYGPICVFTILMPLHMVGIRRTCYRHVSPNVFAGWIYDILVPMALILTIGFFYWASRGENMWDAETNAEYSNAAGCSINFQDLDECRSPYDADLPCFFNGNKTTADTVTFPGACTKHCLEVFEECEEAFILWANPFLAAVALFVIGFISKFLQEPEDPHAHHQISAIVKFGAVFLFLFWIFASLAGAGEGLSSSLIAYAIAVSVGASIIFSAVFWNSLVARSADELAASVAKQAKEYMDVFRGLVVLGFSPVVIVYLVVAAVNQFVRRFFIRHCCRKNMSEAEYNHTGCFTKRVRNQIEDFKLWDHSNVLTIAVYWGIGYVFLNVLAAKLTTVFLSWLIEYTSSMNILAVTGIVTAVGVALFLLPPIPGLPIYLTAGIVLVSVGQERFGLWGAIGYACVVSLALKLIGCAVQQQLIGVQLGGSVSVKQMVSVNSEGIRAMRVMLNDKGVTYRKVAVLVGGPDWPVSVLCGILGLDLLSVLVATLPVIALIAPTVLTGSFAYIGNLETDDGLDLYPWADTLGAVCSAVAAVVMLYFNLAAAGAVKDTLAKDKDIIDAIPLDDEVAKADAEAQKKSIVYRRVTVWSNVPFFTKCCLVLSVLLMMACCYLLVIFNSKCFKEYDLMYTIGEHLGGQWTNIVLPLGRVALLLFVSSWALLYSFTAWAKGKANIEIKAMDENEAESLTDTKVPNYA